MPHSAAGLLRGGPMCFTGSRKPARAAPPRLLRAAAADPAATNSSVRIDTQADGTVTYRFGVEAEPEASKNPAAAAPAAPVPPAAAPAPVAVSLDAPLAAQQLAPAQQAVAVASSSGSSSRSSSNGAVAVMASPPAAGSSPLAVLPPLTLEVLSQNSASPSNGTGSSSSGSGSEEKEVGTKSLNGSGSNGRSRTPEPSQRQQQQQPPPPPVAPPAAIPSTSSRQPAAGQQRGTNGAVRTPGGQQQAPQGQQRRRRSASAPPPDARAIDYTTAETYAIMVTYEDLCDQSNLDEALHLIKECIRAGRSDVLATLRHYRFLRPAASMRAVKQALRFVQLLPRQYVDARTYNMLLRVCARAGDLRNALHVTDMLQAAGLKMDNILYTTLISGEEFACLPACLLLPACLPGCLQLCPPGVRVYRLHTCLGACLGLSCVGLLIPRASLPGGPRVGITVSGNRPARMFHAWIAWGELTALTCVDLPPANVPASGQVCALSCAPAPAWCSLALLVRSHSSSRFTPPPFCRSSCIAVQVS